MFVKSMSVNRGAPIADNDDAVQLTDLLASYPPVKVGFQSMLTAKKEFGELSSDRIELLPGRRGYYFKHQLLIQRVLRAYDDLMLIHETGTGKTCSVFAFTEWIVEQLKLAQVGKSNSRFKGVYILVHGATQKKEIKYQLACRCTPPGKYDTEQVNKAKSEKIQRRNVTLGIGKWYTITTYQSFANKLETLSDDKIREEYSDRVFWIDEGHNLRIDSVLDRQERCKVKTYNTLHRLFHVAQRCKRIISTATPMINTVEEVGPLMNLILPLDMQFTPDFDFKTATLEQLEPYFRGRVSFIRALDTGAVPVEQGKLFVEEVSNENIVYESRLTLATCTMSNFQTEAYLRSQDQSVGRQRDLFGAVRQASNFVFPDGWWGTGLTEEERQIARGKREGKELPAETPDEQILGLPEVSDDEEARAFRRYITVEGDDYKADDELIPWLRSTSYIKGLSCKYADVISSIIKDALYVEELNEDGTPILDENDVPVGIRPMTPEEIAAQEEVEGYQARGTAFVYNDFVVGSGAIALALCFEHMGFERFDERSSIFVGKAGTKEYCVGSGDTRQLHPSFREPKLRYALLTKRNAGGAKFETLMEAMNSYENRHGDIIKVLISSPIGRDGINVNNATQIHLMAAEWTQSGIYQAMSRGIRSTSHIDLIDDEVRRRMTQHGEDEVVARANARVTVKVFKHAAIPNIPEEGDVPGVDLQMYRVAEFKDHQIRRVLRIMKQCAIDCQIHRRRNQGREGDIDGSAVCDYSTCVYNCVDDPPPDYIDYVTYDVFYADEVVEEAARDIIRILSRDRSAASVHDLQKRLPEYRNKYIVMALDRLLSRKTPIRDRFGYTSYILEDNGTFYLDRSYPTNPSHGSRPLALYSSELIGLQHKDLRSILVEAECDEQEEIIETLAGYGESYNTIINELKDNQPAIEEEMQRFSARIYPIIDGLNIDSRAQLLETAMVEYLSQRVTPYVHIILARFEKMIFWFREPVTEIANVIRDQHIRGTGRGRRRKLEHKGPTKRIDPLVLSKQLTLDVDTPMVYAHTIYTATMERTAYAITARYGKVEGRIRILNSGEHTNIDECLPNPTRCWRDCSPEELIVYNSLIQIERAKRDKVFIDKGIYGSILEDGKFRIHNRLGERKGVEDDARLRKRGRECATWKTRELVDILWNIRDEQGNPRPPHKEVIPARGQLIDFLSRRYPVEDLQTWPTERLTYYYLWYSPRKTRKNICQAIQDHMRHVGSLLVST